MRLAMDRGAGEATGATGLYAPFMTSRKRREKQQAARRARWSKLSGSILDGAVVTLGISLVGAISVAVVNVLLP